MGWHSKTHLNQWKVNRDSGPGETTILASHQILKSRFHTIATVYRPPYGKMNLLTVLAFAKLRLKIPISTWTLVPAAIPTPRSPTTDLR